MNPATIEAIAVLRRPLPAGIWVLGFVSLLTDVSSELVTSVLPILMTTVLGASVLTIGTIEGVAEATAAIVKLFSGALSDRLRNRKKLTVLGYSLAAITKPLFPMAAGIGAVFAGRFLDRVGKGIRDAPRDALIADVVTPAQRGAAYGLRQALDSVGGFAGPLLALVLMASFADDVRSVLWAAVLPGVLSVLLLVFAVHEAEVPRLAAPLRAQTKLNLHRARELPGQFWFVVALGAVFTLARFSDAFLVMRALDVGLAPGRVPLVVVVMNLLYSASAYPAGALSDRLGTTRILAGGLLLLVSADIVLAIAETPGKLFAGAALWGLHMGLTQGLLSKLIADAAPAALRGTAFGIYSVVAGLSLLSASVIAGGLWSAFGAGATFVGGAAFAVIALLGLWRYSMKLAVAGN
jgi:MFS family permease